MFIVPKQPFGFSGYNEDEKAKVVGKYVHEKSGSYYLESHPESPSKIRATLADFYKTTERG